MTGGQAVPQSGDLWVGKIHGAGGLAISALEWAGGAGWTDWDHVFTLVFIAPHELHQWGGLAAEAGWYAAEAEPHGARLRWLCTYSDVLDEAVPGGLWSAGAFDLDQAQRAAIKEAMRQAVTGHVGYSVADYLAIGIHRRMPLVDHLAGPALRRYIENTRHQQCAQLADWGYQQAPFQVFNDKRWPGDVMPADIGHEIKRRLGLAA
jgi:hypothetical protein